MAPAPGEHPVLPTDSHRDLLQRKPKHFIESAKKSVAEIRPSYVFPILEWARQMNRDTLKGDVISGLTVGCMLVPQSMAYAILAGLPPIYGLYAASIPLLLYAVMSTSRVQSVGPVAMDSILTFATIGSILSETEMDDEGKVVALAIVLAFFTGLFQLLLGFLRLGVLVNLLSYSVMSGFTSAAALTIGLSQLKYIFGIKRVPRYTGNFSNPKLLGYIVSHLDETNGWQLFLSLTCFAMLLGLRKFKQGYKAEGASIPKRALKMMSEFSALTCTVVGVCWVMIYENAGVTIGSARNRPMWKGDFYVEIVGEVPGGLPPPDIPALGDYSADLGTIIVGAAIIGLVGFMELYAIAKVYSEQKGYRLDANQELIALGGANVLGSFFQGYPIGGSFSRTAVSASAGANTLLSCIIVAAVVILALVVLAPSFFHIPLGSLAAIIEAAVLNLVKISDFRQAYRMGLYQDLVVMTVTFLMTFLFGIQQGIGLGVVLSIVFTLRHSASTSLVQLGQLQGTQIFRDLRFFPKAETHDHMVVVHLNNMLFFANCASFRSTILELSQSSDKIEYIVLDASSITTVDMQAELMLKEVVSDLKKRGQKLIIAGLLTDVAVKFEKAQLIEAIGEENFYHDLGQAVAAIVKSGHAGDAHLGVETVVPLPVFSPQHADLEEGSGGRTMVNGFGSDMINGGGSEARGSIPMHPFSPTVAAEPSDVIDVVPLPLFADSEGVYFQAVPPMKAQV